MSTCQMECICQTECVCKADFVQLAQVIFTYIGWINFENINYTSYSNILKREEFVKWFITLSEQQYIDNRRSNPHLDRDNFIGGTGIGSVGNHYKMQGYTGGLGKVLTVRRKLTDDPPELPTITNQGMITFLIDYFYLGDVDPWINNRDITCGALDTCEKWIKQYWLHSDFSEHGCGSVQRVRWSMASEKYDRPFLNLTRDNIYLYENTDDHRDYGIYKYRGYRHFNQAIENCLNDTIHNTRDWYDSFGTGLNCSDYRHLILITSPMDVISTRNIYRAKYYYIRISIIELQFLEEHDEFPEAESHESFILAAQETGGTVISVADTDELINALNVIGNRISNYIPGDFDCRGICYLGGTGGAGGIGYDYGLINNKEYINTYNQKIEYDLYHNRYYPLLFNLGPNGKFNRSIYRYNPDYPPIGTGPYWENKRFFLFHVTWDVYNDPKDEYNEETYDTRMTTAEKLNRGLYPLTIYYWNLLFGIKEDIKNYLDERFVEYLLINKIIEPSEGYQGFDPEVGFEFDGHNGVTPAFDHHHDARYYPKAELDELIYDRSEDVGSIIIGSLDVEALTQRWEELNS